MTAIKNLPEASTFLAGMVGKVCWRVRETYGDQLVLDIGGRRMPKHPKSGEYGEWYVGSLYSEWSAVGSHHAQPVASSSDSIKRAVAALKVLEQARVASAAVSETLSLHLGFDNGIEVAFRPPSSARDVEYWEVLGPDHFILTAGPGDNCEVRRSNVPMRDQK